MKKTTILILCTLLAFLFVSCAPDSTPTPATPTPPPTGKVEMTEDEKARAFISITNTAFAIGNSFETAFPPNPEPPTENMNASIDIDSSNKLDNEKLLKVINFCLDDYVTEIISSEIQSGKTTIIIKTEEKEGVKTITNTQKIENAKFTVTFNSNGNELKKEFALSYDMTIVQNTGSLEAEMSAYININGKEYNITSKGKEGNPGYLHATINGIEIDLNVLNKIILSMPME